MGNQGKAAARVNSSGPNEQPTAKDPEEESSSFDKQSVIICPDNYCLYAGVLESDNSVTKTTGDDADGSTAIKIVITF
ncbi:hypothetical protein ACLKA7_001512 [Drosophila subpalustris]